MQLCYGEADVVSSEPKSANFQKIGEAVVLDGKPASMLGNVAQRVSTVVMIYFVRWRTCDHLPKSVSQRARSYPPNYAAFNAVNLPTMADGLIIIHPIETDSARMMSTSRVG